MKRSLAILYLLFVVYYLMMMANGIVIEKGSTIVLAINICFFAYLFFLNTVKNPYLLKFSLIYLYLLFILILILNSSTEYFDSLKMFAKYSIALMSFPAGFLVVRGDDGYRNLLRLAIIFVSLFLINYIISTIFHLGGANVSYGGETSVETGNLFDEALYLNIVVMAMVPFFMLTSHRLNLVELLLIIASIAVTIVCMKRMVLLCIAIILLIYSLLSFLLNYRYGKLTFMKRRIRLSLATKFLIILAVIVLAFSYSDILRDQINARSNELARRFEEETRFEEMAAIYEDFYNETGSTALWGKETFNTVGTYAEGHFGDRMIHTNFGIILNGTGFVGLAFYVIISLYFLWVFFKVFSIKHIKQSLVNRRLFILYITLWVVYNAASFSGTIWLTIYPAFSFMVMGGILRHFYDLKNNTADTTSLLE